MKIPDLKHIATQFLTAAADIVLPATCLCCQTDLPGRGYRQPLCPYCIEKLLHIPSKLYCETCGIYLPDGGAHCYHCRKDLSARHKRLLVRSAVMFGPEIRAVIHSFKYQDNTSVGDYLGELAAQSFKNYPELADCDCLVPVPLSGKKLKSRGFNQSELIALKISAITGLPVIKNSLQRVKETKAQASLSKEERRANIEDAFSPLNAGNIEGKKILLIDDVATTCFTLEACAKAALKAKARQVAGLTVARE